MVVGHLAPHLLGPHDRSLPPLDSAMVRDMFTEKALLAWEATPSVLGP